MEVTHPRTLDDDAGPPPATVDARGERVAVKDGTFEVADEVWMQRFASAYGHDPSDLVEEWSPVESEPEADDDDDAEVDPEAFVDRTPVTDVAEDIRDGAVDGQLDAVEEAEEAGRERTTVSEAIADRRATLEEE